MTVMSSDEVVEKTVVEVSGKNDGGAAPNASADDTTSPNVEGSEKMDGPDEAKARNIFSEEELPRDSEVDPEITMGANSLPKKVVIGAAEKKSFLDAVISNTRYTKEYSLFGGRLKFRLRSLTTDETNAMSSWIVKEGSSDSAGLMSGRYRKYLVAAQMEEFNGVMMPPLEEPLFETLGKDGKTVEKPGWINRCSYWDGLSVGVFNAIMGCISDFDMRYSILCQKANDESFWRPDTP